MTFWSKCGQRINHKHLVKSKTSAFIPTPANVTSFNAAIPEEEEQKAICNSKC